MKWLGLFAFYRVCWTFKTVYIEVCVSARNLFGVFISFCNLQSFILLTESFSFCNLQSFVLLTESFSLAQAVETVALLTEYFLESCGLMSCVQLVASHLLHMIHASISPWTWNWARGLQQRWHQRSLINLTRKKKQNPESLAKMVDFLRWWAV